MYNFFLEKAELKESQEQFQHSRKDLKYIAQNHQEVCIGVSKGLQVYEGFSRKNLISHLSTLCLTFLNFRRKVVTTLLETHGSQAHHPSSESGLSNTQLDCVLKRIERNIAILTGQFTPEEESDPSSATFSPLRAKRKEPEVITLAPDDTSLSEYELLLAELLGIPLPRNSFAGESGGENVLKGLARFQIQAESVLFCTAQHFALEESLANLAAAEADAPKPLATSQALKDLQKSLYQELWQDTAPDSLPDAPTHHPHFDGEEAFSPVKSVRTQPTDALPPLHVVEEVNDLMHQQRVEQSRHYLEILNEKATRRKKMIRGLMNLWQAAKAAIVDHNKVPVFAAAGDIELKRLQAMPVEDIIAQTKSIQQLLIRDMQEKSSTKMAQVLNSTFIFGQCHFYVWFLE